MNRKEIFRSVLLPIIFALIPDHAVAVNDTLCKKNEEVFFSCKLEKKIVSLCSSNIENALGYMTYRFGTSLKPELEYQVTQDDLNSKFNTAEILYASNSSTVIWFNRLNFSYVLNFPMRGGPLLQVIKNSRVVSQMYCKNGWTDAIGDPERSSQFIRSKNSSEYLKLIEVNRP
jgi:hypothetical protein